MISKADDEDGRVKDLGMLLTSIRIKNGYGGVEGETMIVFMRLDDAFLRNGEKIS